MLFWEMTWREADLRCLVALWCIKDELLSYYSVVPGRYEMFKPGTCLEKLTSELIFFFSARWLVVLIRFGKLL